MECQQMGLGGFTKSHKQGRGVHYQTRRPDHRCSNLLACRVDKNGRHKSLYCSSSCFDNLIRFNQGSYMPEHFCEMESHIQWSL